MRILFLCTFYHRAMIFRDLMNQLIKAGNEVKAFNAVAYRTKVDDKYKKIMDELVIQQECFNRWDKYIYHLKQFKIYKAVVHYCNIKQFDLIHSHTLFNGGYVTYLIKKFFGIPYVVSVRNTDMNVFLKIPFFNYIANKIINNALGVQFLSKPYKEKYINKYVKKKKEESITNKSIILTNGIEKFWLNHKATAKNLIIKNSIRVLCIGKIDKNKNIKTTINALEILKLKGYNVYLTVVGQIINKKVLKEVQEVPFVRVIHYLKKEELINIYRENDIFVMPSIRETFGRVYAEAMTQGLPVIYTQGQGFDGIFKDGYIGYAVPSNNSEYIADCILKIMDKYHDISTRCINSCEVFNWKIISQKLNNFYKILLEKK